MPAEAAVAPVEHADDPVHPVHDQVVADDRGRGRHLPAARPVPPDHLAVAHPQGVDVALVVGDVGDAVGDDGGELDERADPARPDDLERRPHLDVGGRLRPPVVGAVHRPLQIVAVEAHGHFTLALEGHAHDLLPVARLRDANRERRPPLDLHRRQPARVRVAGALADHDPGALDAPVRVAVDHRHEHLRLLRLAADGRRERLRRRSVGRTRVGRRRRRRGGFLGVAAACRRQAQQGQSCRDEANHASPGSPATGSGSSSANGTRLPPSSAVRHRWEKKRVIRTPARKSPSLGSGRSPLASASASSG